MKVRKYVHRNSVRAHWQNRSVVDAAGLCLEARVNISDDSEDQRVCWCCGRSGYQEIAHIVPASLGGKDEAENLFLLCGECHMLSPDTADRSSFFRWINQNTDRFTKEFESTIGEIWRRLETACGNEDLDRSRRISDSVFQNFEGALNHQMKSIGTHGAFLSTSTLMSAIVAAAGEVIDSVGAYSEAEAMKSHAPWRYMQEDMFAQV